MKSTFNLYMVNDYTDKQTFVGNFHTLDDARAYITHVIQSLRCVRFVYEEVKGE